MARVARKTGNSVVSAVEKTKKAAEVRDRQKLLSNTNTIRQKRQDAKDVASAMNKAQTKTATQTAGRRKQEQIGVAKLADKKRENLVSIKNKEKNLVPIETMTKTAKKARKK